ATPAAEHRPARAASAALGTPPPARRGRDGAPGPLVDRRRPDRAVLNGPHAASTRAQTKVQFALEPPGLSRIIREGRRRTTAPPRARARARAQGTSRRAVGECNRRAHA